MREEVIRKQLSGTNISRERLLLAKAVIQVPMNSDPAQSMRKLLDSNELADRDGTSRQPCATNSGTRCSALVSDP